MGNACKNYYLGKLGEKMNTEKKFDCFEKLVNALQSWKVDISGNKKNLWMHKWDVNLQTGAHLKNAVIWLKLYKSYGFAEGFEKEFKNLFEDVHGFYETLEQGRLSEEEIFHEQIPLLEDSAKQLADYVWDVKKNLCDKDKRIEQNAVSAKEDKPNFNINISGNIQAKNLQFAHDASIHECPIPEKKKSIFREVLRGIVAIIATVVDNIGGYFGWLGRIYNWLWSK